MSLDVAALDAPGGFAADATRFFQAALDRASVRRVTFCGDYDVRGIVVPAGKRLEGCGMQQASLRVGGGAPDAAVTLNDSSSLVGATVNANNSAAKGVAITGDYVQVVDVLSQYARYCFYNAKGNVSLLSNTSHNDCEYGFYSADSWINSIIRGHIGRNGSATSTGAFFTYDKQQPQAVRILSSQFFGDRNAIVFDKDAFSVNVTDGVIDGTRENGITFNSPPCDYGGAGDVYIRGMFVSAAGTGISIKPQTSGCPRPASGYAHVVISENDIANGAHGIVVAATPSSRAEGVSIVDNQLNNFRDAAIVLDSVHGAWVERNTFSAAGSGGPEIVALGTFRNGPVPKVQVLRNRFVKAGTRVAPPDLAATTDNIGWSPARR